MVNIRTLSQLLGSAEGRSLFAATAGVTFKGLRNLYTVLGYDRAITLRQYRDRYERNAIAARVVEAYPRDMWRGGGQLVDDQDTATDTAFERTWKELDRRLRVWSRLQKADILAGVGHYAVILLGAPGELETPLVNVSAKNLQYLSVYGEEEAQVLELEKDRFNPRYGLPLIYSLQRRVTKNSSALNAENAARRVHYSRLVHIASDTLDDETFGTPRLRSVWNLIDDLEKVTGGGAEAFWRRADAGMQLDLDPTMDVSPESKTDLEDQIEKYVHGLKRIIRTRGMKVSTLTSQVADFSKPVDAIIAQISAGTGIPQRILMGSERGQLASTQDRTNWDERVASRRQDYGEAQVVQPFVDRLVELGVLPAPKNNEYEVRWSALETLDDTQRADLAFKLAEINAKYGDTVVTRDELREVLDYAPMEESVDDPSNPDGIERPEPPVVPPPGGPDDEEDEEEEDDDPVPVAAQGKERPRWKTVHAAADRFRGTLSSRRPRKLRCRTTRGGKAGAAEGARGE